MVEAKRAGKKADKRNRTNEIEQTESNRNANFKAQVVESICELPVGINPTLFRGGHRTQSKRNANFKAQVVESIAANGLGLNRHFHCELPVGINPTLFRGGHRTQSSSTQQSDTILGLKRYISYLEPVLDAYAIEGPRFFQLWHTCHTRH